MQQTVLISQIAALAYLLMTYSMKTIAEFSSSSIRVPIAKMVALILCHVAAIAVLALWPFFDIYGKKSIAIVTLVAIAAMAFYSIKAGETIKSSSLLWITQAFALGGVFVLSLVPLINA